MQVDSFVPALTRRAITILGLGSLIGISGLVVAGCVAGCNRAPDANVVATVNGKQIMRADLDKEYKASLDQSQQDVSPEQADIMRLKILAQMMDDEILQQRATKLNLEASDEDVTAKLTEVKALSTQEEFDQKLKASGLTLDDLKRQIRRSLTRTKVLNKEIESKINITDAEIANYYNLHKADFNLIEPRYHLAQIVVTGNPPQQVGSQARHAPNEPEAKKEIQSIHNRIEGGEDFGTLAAQFTENASFASTNGDMGFVPESQFRSDFPDVYAAVSNFKPGQVTAPLPVYAGTGNEHRVIGYAVYKLVSKEVAGQRELNDPRVQQSIRQDLRQGKVQLLQNAYYEKLHDDAKVQNYFAEQVLKQGAQ